MHGTMTGRALTRRQVLAGGLASVVAGLRPPAARAQTISYSKVDQATVRVFAYEGIEVVRATDRRNHTYRLAVPSGAHGSGVMLDDGLIITAAHVVGLASHLAIKVHGSAQAHPARVVLYRPKTDFAILQTTARAAALPLPEGPITLRARQRVHAIGYPIDAQRLTAQSTTGTVSGMTADGLLQLAMAVNPGNSGGPLIDEQDELIGIVVAKGNLKAGIEGLTLAVPIQKIIEEIPKARTGKKRQIELAKLHEDLAARARVAAVTAAVVERAASGGMFSEIAAPTAKDRAILKYLNVALGIESSATPEMLELGAAYYWNAANWQEHKGRSGYQELRARAVAMLKTAVSRDSTLRKRSEFARQMVGRPAHLPGSPSKFSSAGLPGAVKTGSK